LSGIWLDCPPVRPQLRLRRHAHDLLHKDILGWIPAAQRYVAAAGTSQTIMLERLGSHDGHYLMARSHRGVGNQIYTVEVRRSRGYDVNVPARRW